MQTLALEVNNNLEKTNQKVENDIFVAQKSFLQSNIGKAVNTALDIGLKAILPDLIENEIIDIKNAILENGFKEGMKEVINSVIDVGKSLSGIATGNFESIDQIQIAVKNGGILDKASELLDYAINFANAKDLINKSTSSLIKQSKNSIISSISNKIEETLINQIKSIEKLEKYCKIWNTAYGIQDLEKMENAYKNIEKYISETFPLENIINNARKIENIHNLIKNNGNNFNITQEELQLAQRLI